jgi:hypothetical protein
MERKVSPNKVLDQNKVDAPVPATGPLKDDTPWAWLTYAGIGALLIGMVVLGKADKIKESAMAAPDPASKATLLGEAQVMYGIAAACGLIALAMGIFILTRWGQGVSGWIFTAAGAALTGIAVYGLIKAEPTEAEAKAKEDKIAAEAAAKLKGSG